VTLIPTTHVPSNSDYSNIAQALAERAAESPTRIAMHFPVKVEGPAAAPVIRYQDLSFGALESRSNAIAAGLKQFGIAKGMRTVVMVRPSPEFFLTMFALFKLGAVPVLVDPGIDKRALKACLANARPEAFIGIPIAHLARLVLGWGKASIRLLVTVGRRWFWGGATLKEIEQLGADMPSGIVETDANDLAAILFTSGSTGVPKGVEYRHRHFVAQVEMLRDAFQIQPGTVNLPTFPPFALFDPALGCTSVIPVMDPTRPAQADPRKLLSAIRQFSIRSMFGSPALLQTLASYCEREAITVPTMKTVMSAGAPVAPALIEQAKKMLPADARVFTPYGATEALPVAIVEGHSLLGETRMHSESGGGICVGLPLAANTVRIIAISDAPIARWADVRIVATGEVGEITVRGPSVTEAYFESPEKTALAKIDEDGGCVHRMGDVGYFDVQGRLWYCGRKSHRVETAQGTLFTEQVEAIFNATRLIKRSALVGVGTAPAQRPVLIYELWPATSALPTNKLVDALSAIAAAHEMTAGITDFLAFDGLFPVDIRHNAKINREKLGRWAADKLRTPS
jgi:olefin beta-lactone synthetase